MTSIWRPSKSSQRQHELKWLNVVFSGHDQFCDCDDPWLHLLYCINRDSPFRKPLKDIQNIKCLLTGAPMPTTEEDTKPEEDEDGGFFPGELDKLFEENTKPENTEDASER